MAPSFSTTKGVASTLLHMAVDGGLLHYDDRVAEHWPEFAQAGKQEITVRHVLSHTAGYAGWTEQLSVDDGGLRCRRCHDWAAPENVEVYRFEGPSDPADESILFAISLPCGHH